ncbi:MAG TPA: monodechloroaminopyrrolnitrin synthase PrnB family protein, partial [Parvularculaceae bacterium]|nr:monodechloroaminopyrrolnitrin synthase PrnB family protein [Parvularculaceae bacterium]
MTANVEAFDAWIRGPFVEMNTALEELYFAQADRANVVGIGDPIKGQLEGEGRVFVRDLMIEGNTDEGFDRAFGLLGDLGLYMAALRRHEITNPAREEKSPLREASALGLHIGASLGVAPRFATSHLSTHNFAVNGQPKSFTSLKDEYLFVDLNTRAIFAYKRAADALMRITPLGVSHPAAGMLLEEAERALIDVANFMNALFEELDADRFFHSVRPYYKPYRVGRQEYRGANAGDFSGINEIDLLLGLCRANDPYYAQLLVDKMLFMTPEDQARLRDCMRRRPLLDEFLTARESHKKERWFCENARLFLNVCEAHGTAASRHHNGLVLRFIEKPAETLDRRHL